MKRSREFFQVALTENGDIDEALKVKDEIQRIQNSKEVVASASLLKEMNAARASSRTPGGVICSQGIKLDLGKQVIMEFVLVPSGELALDKAGCHEKSSSGKTQPVGRKAANVFGLYDMHGNVSEFVQDRQGPYKAGDTVIDPEGPSEGYNRMHRGDSWNSDANECRSASREGDNPGRRRSDYGFRCVVEF